MNLIHNPLGKGFRFMGLMAATLLASTALMVSSCSDDDDDASSPSAPNGIDLTQVHHVMQKSTKRGVGYSFQLPVVDMLLLQNGISWFYNWANSCGSDVSTEALRYGVTFVPMAWNNNYNATSIINSVNTFGDRYLLAFNEPNLTDQCNMTPSQAAQYWPELKKFAQDNGLQIVSPAMNYGTLAGYSDPVKWLDEFFAQPGVSLDDVCAIALHCYQNNASGLKGFIDKFEKYGKPIWLTEFCAWDGGVANVEAQMNYMTEALAYLEENPRVERYGWFIPRYNGAPYMALLSDEELTDLGRVFVNASSADKYAFALPGNQWPAVHFQSSNASEGVEPGSAFSAAPHQVISTEGTLGSSTGTQISAFTTNKWLQYGVHNTESTQTISLRVKTTVETQISLTVDGIEPEDTHILNSHGDWQTIELPLELAKGVHTVKIKVVKGSMAMGWVMWQ